MIYLGLDHVQVAAPPGSEAEARAFYGELLGMPEIPKPPIPASRGGCWFQCGAQQIHVGIERDFRPAAKAHPGIRLADVGAFEALIARLEAHGIGVKRDREEVPGVERISVKDPWGNRLELLVVLESP